MTHKRLVSVFMALALALTVVAPVAAHWPIASTKSYISQPYWSRHRGIDIVAPRGTRVMPIHSGRVVFAGWKSNCGGYQVWVSHGNGVYSAYYHLSREVSYRGELVTGSSEVIGYVGRSGCATGYHTHLEVWRGYPWRSGSYRVNPWKYINHGYWLPSRYR